MCILPITVRQRLGGCLDAESNTQATTERLVSCAEETSRLSRQFSEVRDHCPRSMLQ
jgi:hypothetical protein